MTEVLASPSLTANHLMCSQSGNIRDLASQPPSCMVGSDTEPDSSSRQEYHPPSLPSDMVRYFSPTDDVNLRFTQESGSAHNPVYSSEPTVHATSLSSTLTFAPSYNHLYQHTPSLSGSTYASGGGYNFPPTNTYPIPGPSDTKPRLGSINSSSLGSLSRSPALPHPNLPIRDFYTGSTPGLLRRTSDILSKSSSSSGLISRGVPLSPTSTSGFTSPISNMDSSLGGNPCPPLFPTEIHYTLETSDHHVIKPEIFGRIDKGFFQADGDWTCYRRNYFSLVCSYTLTPNIPNGSIYLLQPHGGQGPQVHSFAMSIAAVVDGRGGKSIDLVQHTPKRDKGPQDKPARISLAPRPPPPHGIYVDSLSGSGRSSLYDTQGFSQNPNQPAMEATFERIQFKNATANNGKRRAAQQYYHLLVELFAEVGSHAPPSERWVKIASRMSAPMVVRGRSPGHYQSDRRGSNSSNSGPGSGGPSGAGSYTPAGSAGRTMGDVNMSTTSSMMGSTYGSSYDRSHNYRSLHLMDPSVTEDESKMIVPGAAEYMYYPNTAYCEDRHTDLSNKVKHEYNSGGQFHGTLPSLAGYDGFGRRCGPFDAGDTRSYWPTLMHQELNI